MHIDGRERWARVRTAAPLDAKGVFVPSPGKKTCGEHSPQVGSLKNPVFSTRKETAEIRSRRNEFPGWYEFIFLHNRKRLLPGNADLTYMPSNLIEHGEASRLPKPLRGCVTSLTCGEHSLQVETGSPDQPPDRGIRSMEILKTMRLQWRVSFIQCRSDQSCPAISLRFRRRFSGNPPRRGSSGRHASKAR